MKNARFQSLGLVMLLLMATGCENMFSYSVYETRVPSDFTNTTAKNLAVLKAIDTAILASYKVAVLADPHYHYDRLAEAIERINIDPEIKFVIVNGDLADQGFLHEYVALYEAMEKLNKPYFTVIGNHDYLSNAEAIYRQMFGPYNYSVSFNGSRFILFDDVVWESQKQPDFEWLENTLAQDVNHHHSTFVFAHIAPFGDQLRFGEMETRYREAMQQSGVALSVHGHGHNHYHGEHYNDGIPYLLVPWVETGYCELTIAEGNVQFDLVEH